MAGTAGDVSEGEGHGGAGIKIVEDAAQHVFREADGHLAQDTLANRQLLEGCANNPVNVIDFDQYGAEWAAQLQADGSQLWTRSWAGGIRNGGLNDPPWIWNPDGGGMMRP